MLFLLQAICISSLQLETLSEVMLASLQLRYCRAVQLLTSRAVSLLFLQSSRISLVHPVTLTDSRGERRLSSWYSSTSRSGHVLTSRFLIYERLAFRLVSLVLAERSSSVKRLEHTSSVLSCGQCDRSMVVVSRQA